MGIESRFTENVIQMKDQMNTSKHSQNNYMILSIPLLFMFVVAGCSTINIETVEAIPGGINPVETEAEMGNGTETGIGETPMPENLIYSNNIYGFEFVYPETWTLTEEDNGVVLMNGRNRLGIRFHGIDEDAGRFSGRTGIPAGELIYTDKIRFMGRMIPAEVLVFEQKSKIVFYGGTGRIEINELVFSITLDDRETYNYRDVDLSEEIMAEAKTIVETFKRVYRADDPAQEPIGAETGLTAYLELPELIVSGAGLFTFSIHTYFIRHRHPEFKTPVSLCILWSTLLISLAQLGLTVTILV